MRNMIRRRPTVTALLQDILVTLPLLLGWPACAQDAAAADRNALGEQILSKILMAFWTAPEPTFKPDWPSLHAHRDPEWFRDAKFGIYTHWGPVTVGCEDAPQGGEWYGREMYLTKI